MPVAQATQDVAGPVLLYFPTEQGEHEVDLTTLAYFPRSQGLQVEEAGEEVKVPAEHESQASLPVELFVPASHWEHVSCPTEEK